MSLEIRQTVLAVLMALSQAMGADDGPSSSGHAQASAGGASPWVVSSLVSSVRMQLVAVDSPCGDMIDLRK